MKMRLIGFLFLYLTLRPGLGSGGKMNYRTDDECQLSWTPVPNMGAALIGYNPFVGNRYAGSGIPDPGMRNQIFEPTYITSDERIDINHNINFFDEINCNTHAQSSVARNYEELRELKSGSYSFSQHEESHSKMKIPLLSAIINFERETSKTSSEKSNENYKNEMKFFEGTQGEIFVNQATCLVYKVSIDSFAKPVFTEGFIEAMRELQKAAKTPTNNASKQILRNFIHNYGTHYMSEAWLGASITTQSRLSGSSVSSEDQKERKECVSKAYTKASGFGIKVNEFDVDMKVEKDPASASVSTTIGGWGGSSGQAFSEGSQKCDQSRRGQAFFSTNRFSQTEVISVGALPYGDGDKWAASTKESPSVIRFKLTPISQLFKSAFLRDILLDPKDQSSASLNPSLLKSYFDQAFLDYCEIMLGHKCPQVKGCGVNDNCGYDKECVADNNRLGFVCKPKLDICSKNSCRSNEKCVTDKRKEQGYKCEGQWSSWTSWTETERHRTCSRYPSSYCKGPSVQTRDRNIEIPGSSCRWIYAKNWNTDISCNRNEVAVGSCSGGKNKDCPSSSVHRLKCCQVPNFSYKNCNTFGSWWGQSIDCRQTGHKYIAVGQCHSGAGADCHGSYNRVKCCDAVMNGRKVGPSTSQCYWTYRGWGVSLECGGKDYVLTGRCGSGQTPDCPGKVWQGNLCCKLVYL